MDDLYSMTVAQLKERLKEEGLPVSGKKAELIARLRAGEQESFVPDEKYEIGCAKCGTTLRVPTDYSGGITCPNCMTKSQVTNQLTTDEESNLTGIVSDLQGTGASQPVAAGGYDFVTGPGGQLLAIKKSGFSWVDWSIGFFGTLASYLVMWVMGSALMMDPSATCCGIMFIAPPSIIGSVGAASGKSGVGIGAMTAFVAIPVIFIGGCFILLASWGGGY